jgi:glycogen debranching enzyme
MRALHEHQHPIWIKVASSKLFAPLINIVRRDVRYVRSSERLTNLETLVLYDVQRRLRRKNYDSDRILEHSLFAIEDLLFNCILIRANDQLKKIAKEIDRKLPEKLLESMRKAEAALESLWHEETKQYYSRNFVTHNLIVEPSIATLMPLYAGCISEDRAKELVEMLHQSKVFGPKFPVPSVPLNSDWFDPHRYWQGPVWINTNWLIIEGLKRYGFEKEAEHIKLQMLQMIKKSGFYEYFSPIDGSPAGSRTLSWSAALMIDLLN